MKWGLLLIFIHFHALFGLDIKPGDGTVTSRDNNWNSSYIQKKVGESGLLRCSKNLPWIMTTKTTNANLEGFDFSDLQNRTEFKGPLMYIYDLKASDTGMYGCGEEILEESIYIYVKGPQLFLKSKDVVTFLQLGAHDHDLIIPFRTTTHTHRRERVKLFVDNEEWRALCWDENTNVSEKVIIAGVDKLLTSKGEALRCTSMSEFFDPRRGFDISLFSSRLDWSKFNNKRFRCEYGNEVAEVFVQAIQSIDINLTKIDSPFKVTCSWESQPSLDFDVERSGLWLSCPKCEAKKNGHVVNRIIEWLQDARAKREMAKFWDPSKGDVSQFCHWIQQLGEERNSSAQMPFFREILYTTKITNQFAAASTIVVIVIMSLLLFLGIGFAVSCRKMRRAPNNAETVELSQAVSSFPQRHIGHGTFGDVFELIGYDPPAVIKNLRLISPHHQITLQNEFEMLKNLTHANVVQQLKMKTMEGSNDFGLIMEYCQRGNLRNLLTNSEQTCTGSAKGTERYMSPPKYGRSHELQDSHRNDVYSLGLVLWEIVERRLVFSEYGQHGDFNREELLSSGCVLLDKSKKGYVRTGNPIKVPECPACHQKYSLEAIQSEPFTLSCGHDVCYACSHQRLRETSGSITCPQCEKCSSYDYVYGPRESLLKAFLQEFKERELLEIDMKRACCDCGNKVKAVG
ncbi:unnamed protein product, partial [Mesorhabditis belari]|uniref:Protein kinase domain-containing protein n=1 Tax=Mesorhabditis belari TaxID=2138241 RepID=A0AAF3EM52_9BILA